MKLTRKKLALLLLTALASVVPAVAQNWAMPGPKPGPVYCAGCPAPNTGLPMEPYPDTLKFVGRLIDSHNTKDYQSSPVRTLRARSTMLAADKVWMIYGTTFVAYNASTFFTSKLGQPLGSIATRSPAAGQTAPGEQFLPYDSSTYPEAGTSGWTVRVTDNQDFLWGFDVDDRGYAYPAYSGLAGWGVVQAPSSGNMSVVSQTRPLAPRIAPTKTSVFRSGGKYYLLALDAPSSKYDLFDVTVPSAPVLIHQKSGYNVMQAVWSSNKEDMVVFIDASGKLQLIQGSTLVAGGAPEVKVNGSFRGLSASRDTSTFVALENLSSGGTSVSIFRTNGNISPTSYVETKRDLVSGMSGVGSRISAGYVTVYGSSGDGWDVEIYRLAGDQLTAVPLGQYFKKHYTKAPAGNAYAGSYTSAIYDAVVVSYGGKKYLIYMNHGLGDVYELNEGGISLSIDSTVSPKWGTPNPYSKNKSNGPYYGDFIPFTSTSSEGGTRIHWNFGNPEASASGGYPNEIDTNAGQRFSRPYTRLTPSSNLTRTVGGNVIFNPGTTGSTLVTMLNPAARIGLKGSSTFEVSQSGSSAPQMVAGEELVDASDGSIEGHYSVWNLGATTASVAPTTPFPVGVCGSPLLSLEAHYALYTVNGTAATPNDSTAADMFVKSVSNVTLDVRPFVSEMSFTSGPAGLTFKNSSRLASPSIFTSGANVGVTWDLLDASGNSLSTKGYILPVTSVGSDNVVIDPNTFVIAAADVIQGRKVRLVIAAWKNTIAEPSCQIGTADPVASTQTYEFRLPQPQITVTGCANEGAPCTFTATATGGTSSSDWKSISWSVDGVIKSSASSYSPTDLKAGSRTVVLTVTNAIGTGSDTDVLNVGPLLCARPGLVTATWGGTSTGCNTTNAPGCNVGETINFNAAAFGYVFQDCDTFAWTFGDGQQASGRSVSHAYSSGSTYQVRLTVTNSSGSSFDQRSLVVGTPAPPPPPPPPPCADPGGAAQVSVNYNGPGCGLSSGVNCKSGSALTFSPSPFGFQLNSSCDTYRWTTSDGGSSTSANWSHSFAAAGSYSVTFQLTRSGRTLSDTRTITIDAGTGGGSGDCPTPPPPLASLGFNGASGCNISNGVDCAPGETINFTISLFGGVFKTCDRFEWNFNDGSALVTTTSGSTTHVFPTTGTSFNVTVRLYNTAGAGPTLNGTVKFPARSGGAQPPTNPAITVASDRVSMNAPIQFSGSATGTLPAVTWVWDFGDGTTSTQQNPIKSYTRPGVFTVKLIVANGPTQPEQATATKTITVTSGKSFAFLLPAVIHLKNGDGTQWRTDVHIYNPDPAFTPTAPLTLNFDTPVGKHDVSVDASTTVMEDVMSRFTTSESAQGAFIVRGVASDARYVPQMWTRTYLQSPSGVGTYGQLIPAILLDGQANASTTALEYVLPGLQNRGTIGGKSRTNIGLVNPTTAAVTVKLKAYESGAPLGDSVTLTIDPYSLKPINDNVLPTLIPAIDGKIYSLRVISESGTPIVAYASVLDNTSNDPVYIAAIEQQAATAPVLREQLVPVARLTNNNWKTDVTVFNANNDYVTFDLAYYDNAGTELSRAKDISLPVNSFLSIQDVLNSGRLTGLPTGDLSGVLRVITKGNDVARFPVVYSRTYSDQGASGTFGQGIGAVAFGGGNVKLNGSSIIAGVRNSANYKTRVGFLSLSSTEDTTVELTLLDKTTGASIGTPKVFTVTKGQSIPPFDIFAYFEATAVDQASIRIKVTSGAPVWAYSSIIDQTTKDPEYVPATPLN